MPSTKKRYAIVGTGGRVPMFIDPLASLYKETSEIVGLCDTNPHRLEHHKKRIHDRFGIADTPTYLADDFDRMLQEQKPDVVIVCTVDALHDEYIARALHGGCDVITEKPLTTDEIKCRRIFDAVEKTGKSVRVTFNVRWVPGVTKVREIIASGAIGNVKNVSMEYMLDASHGADYFRRWHSEKSQSGGLLVHKSTHHFDVVNWWVNSIPDKVFAFGDLAFYGKSNAIARGQKELTEYDRYTGMAPDHDPFKLFLDSDPDLQSLYLNAESADGYIRDKNVFRDGIDIEDSLAVLVKYRNGVILNYSLTAFCPYEGFRASITGDQGRLEYLHFWTPLAVRNQSNGESSPHETIRSTSLTVLPLFKPPYTVDIPELAGGHGGGDALLQEQMFSAAAPSETMGRNAGHEQGAASALIGFAANKSMAIGRPVSIHDFFDLRADCTQLMDLT